MELSAMKQLVFFDNSLTINIPEEDWIYLCNNRFFTDHPEHNIIQAEFVTGTGITPKKKNLWNQATERFIDYINDLREIQGIDINKMARGLLSEEEKYTSA